MMGIIGSVGAILNIILISRLLYRQFKGVLHVSRLHFLSLALSDILFSTAVFAYALFINDIIKLWNYKNHYQMGEWFQSINRLYSISSLLHMVLITFDEFTATIFPTFHKDYMTWSRILINIAFIWGISLILVSTRFFMSRVYLDWFIQLGNVFAIIGFSAAYVNVIKYLGITKRRPEPSTIPSETIYELPTSSKASISQHVWSENNIKPGNNWRMLFSTMLSLSFTLTFVILQFPYALTGLINRRSWLVYMAMYILFAINAATNPIIYVTIDIMETMVLRREIKRQLYVYSQNGSKITDEEIIEQSV